MFLDLESQLSLFLALATRSFLFSIVCWFIAITIVRVSLVGNIDDQFTDPAS